MVVFLISGYKGIFKWFEYLRQTKSTAAPVKLFDKVKVKKTLKGFCFGFDLFKRTGLQDIKLFEYDFCTQTQKIAIRTNVFNI